MQTVTCPKCELKMERVPELDGQQVVCPACGATFWMPSLKNLTTTRRAVSRKSRGVTGRIPSAYRTPAIIAQLVIVTFLVIAIFLAWNKEAIFLASSNKETFDVKVREVEPVQQYRIETDPYQSWLRMQNAALNPPERE